MKLKDITRSLERSRFFTAINVVGLAIGLAISIMLLLFAVNELSFDKHFTDSDRIIALYSKLEQDGNQNIFPICTRQAYTEVPSKVPGIASVTQMLRNYRGSDVVKKTEHYQGLEMFYTDPDFFKVFEMRFVEGTAGSALPDENALVLTDKYAKIIFGSTQAAQDQILKVGDKEFTVSAVVKELPVNTHFRFDLLLPLQNDMKEMRGIEFSTFYRIKSEASIKDVRAGVEKEYGAMLNDFLSQFGGKAWGITEKFTDIYLRSVTNYGLGERSSTGFVRMLSMLAFIILLLAVTNFMNLFSAQGETRMNETGVRKTNGAGMKDIIKLFFSEVSVIVSISFVLGFVVVIFVLPYFAELINRKVDLTVLANPRFILSATALFVLTVVLSAAYPSFYLSRFNPLEIIYKRIRFSKRRLTKIIVMFQSAITIALISYVSIINKQIDYLQNKPIGYDPSDVMIVLANAKTAESFQTIKQELLKIPGINQASGGQHIVGGGNSGQGISLSNEPDNMRAINEYRLLAGVTEMMNMELVEGEFYKEDDPKNNESIILNESAVGMLGLTVSVVGTDILYNGGLRKIIGVVKNFIYDDPGAEVAPLAITTPFLNRAACVYVKFEKGVDRSSAARSVSSVFQSVDPDFNINPVWAEDIYENKFKGEKTQSKIVSISSLLSIFIAMLGLLAVHSYSVVRRTKEIGIRRVNGASRFSIYSLLSFDLIKRIVVAGVIAVPFAYWFSSTRLNDYADRVKPGVAIFLVPIVIQIILAIFVTSGISFKVLSQNPVNALKTE